jgi:hypothetical protein
MGHPAIIRTDFASAEDAAHIYGVSERRVGTIQRALAAGKKTHAPSLGAKRAKAAKRGKKRRAKRK